MFLVLEIANNGQRAAQITHAFLEIESSSTDRQPYISTYAIDPHCFAPFDPTFGFLNYGWGEARDSTLTFAFGDRSGPKTAEMTIPVGEISAYVEVSAIGGLEALGIDADKLANGDFQCASEDAYDRCLTDWKNSDLLAPLNGAVFPQESYIFTRLWGHLDYVWTDVSGAVHKRSSPVERDIHLVNVGDGPECGAPGPVERDFATFELPLDKTNVRMPVKLSDKLAPRQEKRYGFNLIAKKSSHHRFRFVFALADGSTVTSPMVDLTYFIPRVPTYN